MLLKFKVDPLFLLFKKKLIFFCHYLKLVTEFTSLQVSGDPVL